MTTPPQRFPRAARMAGPRQFAAVFARRTREDFGWAVLHGSRNEVALSRLGLSVGARVGGAVERGRIKRLLREAFRLERGGLPKGLDLVVAVRVHRDESLEECRQMFVKGAAALAQRLAARDRRQSPPTGGSAPVDES